MPRVEVPSDSGCFIIKVEWVESSDGKFFEAHKLEPHSPSLTMTSQILQSYSSEKISL